MALGDVLASPEAKKAVHPLEVALGRDFAGRAILVNLAEMPHVLVSGTTGSGKSSYIHLSLIHIYGRPAALHPPVPAISSQAPRLDSVFSSVCRSPQPCSSRTGR